MSAIASRMAARSTTAGTPVKSCITTRAGVKAISSDGSADASQRASFSMLSSVTATPSSLRRRFSSSTFRENGSRATSNLDWSASSRKISKVSPPTSSSARASKEFSDMPCRCRRPTRSARERQRAAVEAHLDRLRAARRHAPGQRQRHRLAGLDRGDLADPRALELRALHVPRPRVEAVREVLGEQRRSSAARGPCRRGSAPSRCRGRRRAARRCAAGR